jgi:hypothetical protein
MKRLVFVLLASLIPLSAGTARAQFAPPSRPNYGPGYKPPLSPYLNLLRGGDQAANYFLGTIPEQQRRLNATQFATEINALDQRTLGAVLTPEASIYQILPGTGHPTAFGTTGYYFGNTNPYGAGGGQRPLAGRGQQGQQPRP